MLAALGCLVTLTAQAATSVSHYGITWTFSADRPVGTFVNGEPWVQGPVTITAINPNPSQSTGTARVQIGYGVYEDRPGVQHGSMVNPTPSKKNGFDRRLDLSYWSVNEADKINYSPALNVALALPNTLSPGDMLVSAKSQIPADQTTWLKTICALTVVASPPAAGSFRPSIFGPAVGRATPPNISQLDFSVLKNFTATPATPTKASIEASMPNLPWFEWGSAWNGNQFQPTDNTADGDRQYGREIAGKFGKVGLWLNTNQSRSDKQAIAIQMVQCGLDIAAYLKHGGGFYHDGGHKCGRKLPLVFAAMMLNDPELKAMAANPDLFQEDQQTWIVTQADVGRVIENSYPGYPTPETYRQEDVGMGEWGIRHRFEPMSDNRNINTGYREVVGPAMMGSWLAADLMGARSIWNHNAAFAYMERWHALNGNVDSFTQQMYLAYKGNTPLPPTIESAVSPEVAPPGGTFDTPQSVVLSTITPSATIRYTLNGVTPTLSDNLYINPLTISESTTVKTVAYAPNLNPSAVITRQFNFAASTPAFIPAPGSFMGTQTVTITSSTQNAVIRYTLDGSEPNANSQLYTSPVVIDQSAMIKAIATREGMDSSAVASGLYSINSIVGSKTWGMVGFSAMTEKFTYGFDMTATSNNMDGVVGLGGINPVMSYQQLACIVRFNTDGKIDARNGNSYAALVDIPYQAGVTYSVRVIVDPVAKTYEVKVAPNGGDEIVIASNFSFRTEQTSLATFNTMALYSLIGTHSVANYGLSRPSQIKGLSSTPTR